MFARFSNRVFKVYQEKPACQEVLEIRLSVATFESSYDVFETV